MPDKVVRSGVAHSVVTNEITRNAINPRNQFIASEKTSLEDIADEFVQPNTDASHTAQHSLEQPTIQDRFDTHASLSVAKTHITINPQKLTLDKPTDKNLFFESLQKLEDRIQHLRAEHPTQNQQLIKRQGLADNYQSLGHADHLEDNIQSLDKKSYSDNRQLIAEKIIGDNFQNVGPVESTHDKVLYKEKKNIQVNLQHVTEQPSVRTSAKLPNSLSENHSSPLNMAVVNLEEMNEEDMNAILDAAMNSFNEEELRARIRTMKERLASANKTLKDIEDQDFKDSSQEP